MKKIKYIIGILVISLLTVSFYFQEDTHAGLASLEKQLMEVDLDTIDELMIVAHPDDEVIWAGDALRKGRYLVVCLTNQSNQIRAAEFMRVMNETNNSGVILDYPDKTKGQRDKWTTVKEDLKEDIAMLLREKTWQRIVTHNPEGEYGHIHHQLTSALVREVVGQFEDTNKLYYFGKYVSRSQLDHQQQKVYLHHPLSNSDLRAKQKLANQYRSQAKVIKDLQHMFPYENFIACQDWKAS